MQWLQRSFDTEKQTDTQILLLLYKDLQKNIIESKTNFCNQALFIGSLLLMTLTKVVHKKNIKIVNKPNAHLSRLEKASWKGKLIETYNFLFLHLNHCVFNNLNRL